MSRALILLPSLLLLLSAQPGFAQDVNYSVECDAFATASLDSLGILSGDPENIRDDNESTALLFQGTSTPLGLFWKGQAEVDLGHVIPTVTRVEVVHALIGSGGGTWDLFLRVGAVWEHVFIGTGNFGFTTDTIDVLASNVTGVRVVARGGNGPSFPSNYELYELRVIGPAVSFLCDDQVLGFFGIKSCGLDSATCPGLGNTSSNPATLFSFLPGDDEIKVQGLVRVLAGGTDVDGLAFSEAYDLLAFELLDSADGPPSASRLISIDRVTANTAVLGPALTGRNIRGAAFDFEDQLWVVDSNADELLRIGPVSGLVMGSPVPLTRDGLPFPLSETSDIAFRRDGLLVLMDGSATLYAVDTATGNVVEVFQDTEPDDEIGSLLHHAGIAFSPLSPFDLYAYDVRQREDLFLYEMEHGGARTELHSDIIPGYNAGLGDLASQTPGCAELPDLASGLQLEAVNGGQNLRFQWDDDASAVGYVIFQDVDGAGPFFHTTGSSASGSTGLTIQMPEDDLYFLLAGDNACGIGPKH